MMAYYNEWEPYPAQWLRNLIKAGLIAPGDVDERSIKDVKPDDLRKYTQCHFFAGIGGWSYALRLAGWADDRHVWTGSCPCQPFSAAGSRKGFADDRHLWPDFYRLIAECKPTVCFGEQVASKDGLEWLDRVRADLESSAYAFGAADLCAAGVGAPHIRQRLYWMADADSTREYEWAPSRKQSIRNGLREGDERVDFPAPDGRQHGAKIAGSNGTRTQPQRARVESCPRSNDDNEGLGNAAAEGLQEQRREYIPGGERCSGLLGFAVQAGVPQWNGITVALECKDGYRRASAQPNAFPVAHGVLKRMGKLRGSGNAIVPQVAQAFIEAFMEVRP